MGINSLCPSSYAGQEEASDWNKQRADSWHHQLRVSTWRDMVFIEQRLCMFIASTPRHRLSPSRHKSLMCPNAYTVEPLLS